MACIEIREDAEATRNNCRTPRAARLYRAALGCAHGLEDWRQVEVSARDDVQEASKFAIHTAEEDQTVFGEVLRRSLS